MTDPQAPGLGPPLDRGAWAGWSTWTSCEPFEEHAGPFYARRETDGSFTTGFRPSACNLNAAGYVHGGAITTFADYSLFLIAHKTLRGQSSVTVTLNTEFVGAGRANHLMTARGDVLRAGKSLVFVRGLIEQERTLVASFSGTLKIVGSAS